MVDIAKIRSTVSTQGNRNVALSLAANKQGLQVSGNAVVRWVRSRKASANREVSRLFISALKKSYGDQIADQVISATGLAAGLKKGQVLRTRKVIQALDFAEDIKQRFVAANQKIVDNYDRPFAEGFNMTPLRLKFDQAVTNLLGSGEDAEAVKARVDFEGFGRKFKEEVEFAGKKGERFVTSEQAGKMAESLALRQVAKSYRALLAEKVDIGKEGSLSQQLWSKINPDPATGLSIDLSAASNIGDGLSIGDEINLKLTDKLDVIYRKLNAFHDHDASTGTAAPTIGVSPEELNAIVEKVVGKFAGERFAAAQAAQELPVSDAATKGRMLQEIVHGSMPASMVPTFCKVYPRLSQSFIELGKNDPRPPPEKLEKALTEMHDTTMEVIRAGQASFEGKETVMRSLWRVALAGHDSGQVQGIIDQMAQQGSPLWHFGRGVHYYRYDFGQSDACLKAKKGVEGEGARQSPPDTVWVGSSGRQHAGEGGIYQSSIDTASNYDYMLNNLAQLCKDKTGAPEPLVGMSSLEALSDNAVTMMRNLGIKVPAPNRLGEENSDFRLSDQALEKVQGSIAHQSQRAASTKVVDGVLTEFTRDLGRATYRLQGEDLGTDPKAILDRLREFCTDGSGKLNEEMLLGISKVAYQATLGSLMSILSPGSEHIAPFQSMPAKEGGSANEARPEYDIGKNEKGEVTVHMKFSGPVQQLNGLDSQTGELTSVQLKTDVSRFGMTMDVSLNAETFEPVLNEAGMDYAFYPESYA